LLLSVPVFPPFIYKDPTALTESCVAVAGTVSWGTVSGDTCSKGLIVFVVLEIQSAAALASVYRPGTASKQFPDT